MKILFDQNVPANLREHLPEHEVKSAAEMGWSRLVDGTLLPMAEKAFFDIFITGDRQLRYQQNLSLRSIAIVELTRCNWPLVASRVEQIRAAVEAASAHSYTVVDCHEATPKKDQRGS